MSEQGNVTGNHAEAGIGGSSVSLAPQWLADGTRGTAATGWRHSSTAIKQPSSRFDTSNPGQRWRADDERTPAARGNAARWGGAEPERWGETGTGHTRQYTEPYGAGTAGERWGGADALGRGRGRASEVDSWKARDGTDWRAPGDPSLTQPRTEWRSDRWGAAPGGARADTWRGPSGVGRGFSDTPMEGGRGFGMSRGRGMRSGGSFSSLKAGGGGISGTAKLGRSRALYRYTTDELSRLYRQLLYTGRLKLPSGVEKDDPLLFLTDGEFLDVMEQFIGIDPTEAAQAFTAHYAALERQYSRPYAPTRGESEQVHTTPSGRDALGGIKPEAPSAAVGTEGANTSGLPDQWVYKDPQGMVQGPFPKQDIMDWYEGGFFPLDLPIRNVDDLPDAPFRPLSVLLKVWNTHNAPPGFPAAAASAAPNDQPKQAAVAVAEQAVPSAAPAAKTEDGNALNLPDDLHPAEDDVLTAALKHMDIKPAPTPVPAPAAPGAVSDPVIDPALVKRIPSDKHLAQLGASAPTQPAQQAAPLQQQPGGIPLPGALHYGAPGAPLMPAQAEGFNALPFLQQQQHPQHHPHPMAAPVTFMGQPHALRQEAALLPREHMPHLMGLGPQLMQPHHQQQMPVGPGMHTPSQPEMHAAPSWGHGMPPALPPQQPVGGMSLLDIQREELQKAESACLAAAAPVQQQSTAPKVEAPAPPAPSSTAAVPKPQPPAPKPSAPAPVPKAAPPSPQPSAAQEEPERLRPETKVAPWVGTSKTTGSSKSLLQIQEEEAERQALLTEKERLQQELTAMVAAAATPLGSGWAKAAAAGVLGVVVRARSLKQIQEEEMRQTAAARATPTQQQQQQQQPAPVVPRAGPTLGDVIDQQLGGAAAPPAKPVWGVNAPTPSTAPSLRELMHYEESAADLEGGLPTDFSLVAPPPPAQQHAVLPAAQPVAAEEAEEDELLFWDYGVPQAKTVPPATSAPAPPPVKPARWDAAPFVPAMAPAPSAIKAANGPAAKPAPKQEAAKSRPVAALAAPAPPPVTPLPTPAVPTPAFSEPAPALTGAFREWCQQQMRVLSGNDDVTLCEFLLTVEANSEVAEYITMYLGASPAAARFSADFMKRKLAEAANAGKKGKKGKKQAAVASASAATPPAVAPVPVTYVAPVAASVAAGPSASSSALPHHAGAAGIRSAPGPPSEFPSLGAAVGKAAKKESEWEKIPKSSGGSKKRKGKGLKVDSTLLGFGTGTNYAVLEQPE